MYGAIAVIQTAFFFENRILIVNFSSKMQNKTVIKAVKTYFKTGQVGKKNLRI
jgi:hypothetical protein